VPSMAAQEEEDTAALQRIILSPLVDGGLSEADRREVASIRQRCPHVFTEWACATPCERCGQLQKGGEAYCNGCQEATANEAADASSLSEADLATDATSASDEDMSTPEEDSSDDDTSEENEDDVDRARALLA